MIIKHIIELLKKDGEVYVNGLGLFKKIFHEATTEGDQLIPPHNEVTLQEDATGNGVALVMDIANQKKGDVTAADEEVKKWVNNLKKRLKSGKEVAIAGFGAFTEVDGKITFASEDIPYLNAEYEGMEPLAETKKGRKKRVTVAEISTAEIFNHNKTEDPKDEAVTTNEGTPVEPIVTEEPTAVEETEATPVEHIAPEEAGVEEPKTEEPEPEPVKAVAEQPEAEIPTVEEPEEVQKEAVLELEEPIAPISRPTAEPEEEEGDVLSEKKNVHIPKRPKRGTFLVLSLIVIVLLVSGYYLRKQIMAVYHPWRDAHKQTTVTIEKPVPPTDEVADTLAIQDTTDIFTDTFATTDDEDIVVEHIQEIAAKPQPLQPKGGNEIPEMTFEPGKYYVIAGSFISTADARIHIKQCHLESHNPVILRQNGSQRIRVCIGIFATENEAQTYAASVNSKYWVLK